MRAIRNPAQIAQEEPATLQTAPEPQVELLFDYAKIEDSAKRSRAMFAAQQIKLHGRRIVRDVWSAGRFAIQTKADLGHGLFKEWGEAEFGKSLRTVERWMTLAERTTLAQLDDTKAQLTALFEATAPSTPDAVLEQVLETGKEQTVTRADVQEMKKAARSTNGSGGGSNGSSGNTRVIGPDAIEIDSEGMWRVDHLSACNRALGALRRLLADANNHGLAAFALRDGIVNIEEYVLSL